MSRPAGGARGGGVVPGSFTAFLAAARARGELVVQPRMGFSDPGRMREGLRATRAARATTVGTLTLDSYTRIGDYDGLRAALASDTPLNGYPIVSLPAAVTRSVLDGLAGPDFPVQIRHGSARPCAIVEALTAFGLDATEGGPISYCLPYGRVPVRDSIREWARACRLFLRVRDEHGVEPHLESFGGCMLGQLCPPGLLLAITVLECLFFRAHGLRSVSLSYAQQTSQSQDLEALGALRVLAAEYLGDVEWHIVLYTYMGVYPVSRDGALSLLCDSAELAVRGGAARLIVKTSAESSRVPTIAENIEALELAEAVAAVCGRQQSGPADPAPDTGILAEARTLIEAVLDLHPDLDEALGRAVERGFLDVPYCLHPDNPGRTRSRIDPGGALVWSDTGSLPLGGRARRAGAVQVGSAELLSALYHMRNRYDADADRHPVLRSGGRPDPAVTER